MHEDTRISNFMIKDISKEVIQKLQIFLVFFILMGIKNAKFLMRSQHIFVDKLYLQIKRLYLNFISSWNNDLS